MTWRFPRMDKPDYMIRCQSCTFSKKAGRAGIWAGQIARKHSRRFPEHTIRVYESVLEYGPQAETLFRVSELMKAQGLIDDKPPF